MRSTKITSVTKHPKSRPSLGLFKDSADNKIKVFDERGFIEELSGLQGPPGPQGNQGIQGEPGPVGPAGLNWQGSWVSGTSYVADDAVGYNGASYFCIQATSGTTAPSSDTTHWALLASQGARGPQGIQGVAGPAGPVGSFYESNVNSSYSYNFNSSNVQYDAPSDEYYAQVGLEWDGSINVIALELTVSDITFPTYTGGSGTKPMNVWFLIVPSGGKVFNQFDFFTIHYQSLVNGSWSTVANNSCFTLVRQNINSSTQFRLILTTNASSMPSGRYIIVQHEVKP